MGMVSKIISMALVILTITLDSKVWNPSKAKEELIEKGRQTVGFYRGATPTILTVDPELIKEKFHHQHHIYENIIYPLYSLLA